MWDIPIDSGIAGNMVLHEGNHNNITEDYHQQYVHKKMLYKTMNTTSTDSGKMVKIATIDYYNNSNIAYYYTIRLLNLNFPEEYRIVLKLISTINSSTVYKLGDTGNRFDVILKTSSYTNTDIQYQSRNKVDIYLKLNTSWLELAFGLNASARNYYSFYILDDVVGNITFYNRNAFETAVASDITVSTTEKVPVVLSKWYEKKAGAFGDSITFGYLTTNGGYVPFVKSTLGLSAYDNYAISGRPIANGTVNGDGTNTTVKTVNFTTANYDLVTIAGGTNDFKLNVAMGTLGVIGDTVFDTNTFYGAYRDLIEYILTQDPATRIVLLTPLQRDNGGYDVNTVNSAGNKLIDYINAIKTIGQMYSLPVIDMYSNSGFTKKTLGTFTSDGLHPNDAGALKMATYISSQLINV